MIRPFQASAPRLSLAALLFTGALVSACSGGDAASDSSGSSGSGLIFVRTGDGGVWEEAVRDDATGYRPEFVDFGTVPDGETVAHTFFLKNTEEREVAVERVVPSCGCTVPLVSYRTPEGHVVEGNRADEPVLVLPPDAVLEVRVQVSTDRVRTKNVDKLNTVKLTLDSDHTPYIGLEAHIIAERAFQATPSTIDLGSVAVGGVETASTTIIAIPGMDAALTELIDVPEAVIASLERNDDRGAPHWVLEAQILPPLRLGRQSYTIRIAVEDSEGLPRPPYEIKVTADGVPDVEFRPARLHAGYVEPGVAAEAEVELVCNLSGMRTAIEGAEILGDHAEHLSVDWGPLGSDSQGQSDRWRLTLHVAPTMDATESFSGRIRLTLADDQHPEVEVPYVGFRRPADS